MAKAITKPIFGVPSIETASRINDSDKAAALNAAHYRCSARLRELEATFELKASEIRAAYLSETAAIFGNGEGAE